MEVFYRVYFHIFYFKDDLGNFKGNLDYIHLLSFVLTPESLKSLFYNIYPVNVPVLIYVSCNDATLILAHFRIVPNFKLAFSKTV